MNKLINLLTQITCRGSSVMLLAIAVTTNTWGSDEITFEEAVKRMEPYMQWKIGSISKRSSRYVIPDMPTTRKRDHRDHWLKTSYQLRNSKNYKWLKYEKQGTGRGINLGWTKSASISREQQTKYSNWHFVPERLSTKPIQYGEPIAIAYSKTASGKNKKKPYLKYGKRRVGINLEWSKSPQYEWQILGGKPGTPVKKRDPVIIYNTKSKRPLIYFQRSAGAHIGWPDSQKWGLQTAYKVAGKLSDDIFIKILTGAMVGGARGAGLIK